MTLTELQEKRGRLVTQAREALNEIKVNTDEARAKELEERHDQIMAEFDATERLIERERKLAEIEARAEEERVKRRPIPGDGETRGQASGDGEPEYREVFRKIISGATPGDLTTEERLVLRGGAAEFRAQTAGSTTAGGYTVPTTLAQFIIRSMLAWGPMYDDNICTTIATTSGEAIRIPTIDDTSKSAGAHTEGAALTDDGSEDVTVGQKALDAYMYDTEFVKWSIELSQDSIFNWEQLLADLLGERMGRKANSELTTANGTSKPNGIVNASTLGKTAVGTTAITYDEIIDLEHSVDPAYRLSPKSRFMMNDSTLKAVRKLKDGAGNYLWQQGNLQAGIPSMLNNRPYSINQAMASMTTGNKVMLFGDFGKYYVRKVGQPIIGVMRERFWPDLGIAGLIRFDGELGDTAAVKHLIMA